MSEHAASENVGGCDGVFKKMLWMSSLQLVYVRQLAKVFAYVLPMASKSILDCVLFVVSRLISIHRAVHSTYVAYISRMHLLPILTSQSGLVVLAQP